MSNIINYNPDVLDALANLSNDEVFTPPKVVNQILDTLPQELWNDKNATFLDPATKSGVFIREIAKRLIIGLETEIPDLQERLNHIFTKQLYGIAITELTSLLSRRSLYCSKYANGKYSVATNFETPKGNILFNKTKHTWKSGKCLLCGASQLEYDRDVSLETHAYEFIHKSPVQILKLFNNTNMKFDVIIGNPPYQLSDGGGVGSSAIPIYQEFVEKAKRMNPRYLSMIIPSRWFSGGRSLDDFRKSMINDTNVRVLNDFIDASMVFPGVEIKGGVCFFLWDRDHKGLCRVISHKGEDNTSILERKLNSNNSGIFIRYNEAIDILTKISSNNEVSFFTIVSANDPFGFDVRVENSYKRVKPTYIKKKEEDSVVIYYNGWRNEGIQYVSRKDIKKNLNFVDKYKVYIPKAWGSGDISSDYLKPFLGELNTCTTETYLLIGPFDSKSEAENVIKYIQTKFFHFLVGLSKITQNTMKKEYKFVPLQDFTQEWTDEKLYKKYNLTQEEIDFIESMIRPMN